MTCVELCVISNKCRDYKIGENKHTISKKIQFDCEIQYSQHKINELYKHIKFFVKHVLNKFVKDDYWAVGGTLLGTIRHQGLIVWDDDADFAITLDGFKTILKNLPRINSEMNMNNDNNDPKYELCEYFIGFKLYYGEKCIVDLFVVDYLTSNLPAPSKKMVYSGHIHKGKSTFVQYKLCFPFIYFYENDIFPLKKGRCEDFEVNIPHNSQNVLFNNYNKSCLSIMKQPPQNQTALHDSFFNEKRSLYIFTEYKNKCYKKYPNVVYILCCVWLVYLYQTFSKFKDENDSSVIKYKKKVMKRLSDINIEKLITELPDFMVNERRHIERCLGDCIMSVFFTI